MNLSTTEFKFEFVKTIIFKDKPMFAEQNGVKLKLKNIIARSDKKRTADSMLLNLDYSGD